MEKQVEHSGLKSSAKYIQMKSLDSLLGLDDPGERLEEIPLAQLVAFEKHPYQVLEDEKMEETLASIQEHGVLMPILVRPKGRRRYEIVSGHRRTQACRRLGLDTIPAIVRDLDDETATILMVDSNIQREKLLFSEKAFAYSMKLEAMKRQGQRRDLPQSHPSAPTSSPVGNKFLGELLSTENPQETSLGESAPTSSPVGNKFLDENSSEKNPQETRLEKGQRADQILAQWAGESKNQIHRYIRLTHLVGLLLTMVDEKKLPFQTGVELSYLEEDDQEVLYKVMEEKRVRPTLEQAVALRRQSKAGTFDQAVVEAVLLQQPKKEKTWIRKEKIRRYFPPQTSGEEMEAVIVSLLEKWKEGDGNRNQGKKENI